MRRKQADFQVPFAMWMLACAITVGLAGFVQAWPWSRPKPTGSLTFTPSTVKAGEATVRAWSGGGGTVYLDGQQVSPAGNDTLRPTETTTSWLQVTGGRWRQFQTSATVEVIQDPTPPDPPQPPDPPTPPSVGLNVAIVGPEPRALRQLPFDQVAILTSRTLRDWTDAACEKDEGGIPAFRVLARSGGTGLLSPRWTGILAKAPTEGWGLVATIKDKTLSIPLPADTTATIASLAQFAGVQATPKASSQLRLRTPTPAEWKAWTSPSGHVTVNGVKRYLSAKPRNLKKHPYGAAPGTVSLAATGINLVPRSEWQARVTALKKAKAGLASLAFGKVPTSDQSSTNYCWSNCVSGSISLVSYEQGQIATYYSAASIGGPITGYRNEGGWPADAIQFTQQNGCVLDSLWPNAAISSKYASKPEVKADYPKHQITSVIADLGESGKMFDECATVVLCGGSVAVSYNWWRHAIIMCGLDFDSNGKPLGVFRNSWSADWPDPGAEGFFTMPEGSGNNKGTPDDAQAVLHVKAQ